MSRESYSLVGDIGGTNARFALVRQGQVPLEAIRVLSCRDYDNLDKAVASYLADSGVPAVDQVCLAVASPVRGTQVQMTNNHWCFDTEAVRQQFGWSVFKVINDFAAMALGVLHVADDQRIHVCGGPGDPSRPRLVMGPGTGLGVSGLVPTRSGWVPLMTEGGHVDFAPTNEAEMAVLSKLRDRFGRVSVERILCGQGLVNLYQALAEIQGVPAQLDAPEKITEAVARGDRLARQTLEHFCEILGRTAGNGVLTLGSLGGVYLCGGILPRFLDFFLASGFRKGFEDKGRMQPLLEFTPVYLVTDPYTGLLGAAEALNNVEV